MPAAYSKKEFISKLNDKFDGAIVLKGKYEKSSTLTKFQCNKGHTWITMPKRLLVSRVKVGCPDCSIQSSKNSNRTRHEARIRRGEVSPWAKLDKYKKVIYEKFGSRIEIKKYNTVHDIIFHCNDCGNEFKQRAEFYKNKHAGCPNCAIEVNYLKGKDPDVTPRLEEFVLYAYRELFFNIYQIASLTGYTYKAIFGILKDAGISRLNGETRRLKNELYLANKGLSLSYKDLYRSRARRLTAWVLKNYKHFIGKPKVGQHLDHILSISAAFAAYTPSLDLGVLCHPCNLQWLHDKDNLQKRDRCHHTYEELQKKIEAFTKKYGQIKYPKDLLTIRMQSSDIQQNSRGVVFLGLDPGSKNFGMFVGRLYGSGKLQRVEVLERGILDNRLEELKDSHLAQNIDRFMQELGYLYEKYMPDVVIIERFIARGIKGKINELTNVMIGIVLTQAIQAYSESIPVIRTCTSASWKNEVNRHTDLKRLYKLGHKLHKLKPHEIDACLMALYHFPCEKPLSFLRYRKKTFLKALVNVSAFKTRA